MINEFLSSIDWSVIPEEKAFGPLPAGDYNCSIDAAEVKQTKTADGAYIAIKWKVVSGDCAGRFIFDNVTIHNSNAQAVQIGLSRLKRIAAICGMDKLDNIESLNGKIFSLSIVEEEFNGRMNNKIKFIDVASELVAPAAPKFALKPTTAAASKNSMPWAK